MSKQLGGDERTQIIWAACLIVPQLLAIVSTIFRLIYRKRNQGLWWDDYFALISLVLAFMLFTTTWLTLREVGPTLRIIAGWLFSVAFPSLMWTTRISLILCIVRIMPRQHPIFSVILYIAFFFGAIGLALVIELMVACGRDTSWTHAPPYIYTPSRATGIPVLCADLFGDILLIAIPLRLFWHAKLLPIELCLIKTGFAASILTTASSISCAVLSLTHNPRPGPNAMISQIGVTQILASLSLLVCNMLVIITFLYRCFRRHEEEQPTQPTHPSALLGMSATQITHDQYTSTYPSNFTMPTNLTSVSEPTYLSDVRYLHTFSNP